MLPKSWLWSPPSVVLTSTMTCLPKVLGQGCPLMLYHISSCSQVLQPAYPFGTVSKCHSLTMLILFTLSKILGSPLTVILDSLAATSLLQDPHIPFRPTSGHLYIPRFWSPASPCCSRMHKEVTLSLSVTGSAKQCQEVLAGSHLIPRRRKTQGQLRKNIKRKKKKWKWGMSRPLKITRGHFYEKLPMWANALE